MDKLMMEISQQAIEKVFSFIKGIDASVTYEDNFDYSKGIKGAEVSYTPETIEELASELELEVVSQSHIVNLEAEKSELESALTITTTSRNFQKARADNLKAQNKELIDKYSTLVQDYSSKFYEQAKEIRELREALNNVILAVAEKDAGASYPRLMKCQSIAIKALKEDKQDG